jgi:hypothetical protein
LRLFGTTRRNDPLKLLCLASAAACIALPADPASPGLEPAPSPLPVEKPAPPLAFRVGRIEFRPFGFVDMIGTTRSSTTHDDISTRLGSVPLDSGPRESLMSLRNSRLAIRAETGLGAGTLAGYLETDFLNHPAQQPYRFRQYFGQYSIGGWDFSAGQEWSMLRPGRSGITTVTSMMHTRVADAGYHVGLLGYRNRQVRVLRHAGSWQAGLAFENGRDFLPKLTHDGRLLHWEVTGVAGAGGHHGASAATVVHIRKKVDLVTQQSWIRKGGKDLLNAVPAGVAAGSSLAGIEAKLPAGFQAYAYSGVAYGARSAGNRQVREWTLGFSHALGRDTLGPAVVNLEFAQLDRALWTGAHGGMHFSMISIRHYLGTPQ